MMSSSLMRACRTASIRSPVFRTKILARSFASALNTEFKTLVEMQLRSCELHAPRDLFGVREGNAYRWVTYAQFGEMVNHFRAALALRGVKKDDKVAIISNNRLEWAVGAYASFSLGAQFVPMYEAQLEKDWHYILGDSDAKILLVSKEAIYDKCKDFPGKIGKVEQIFCFDAEPTAPHSYAALYNSGKAAGAVAPLMPVADDVASIIYTSGTTGKPKGVELTHKNICSVILGVKEVFPADLLTENVRAMAFLPWAHIFGQTCDLHTLMAHGSSMGIVSDVTQVVPSLQLIRPTLIQAVPLFYKRIYDQVQAKVSLAPPFRQKLIKQAFSVARRRNELLDAGKSVPLLLSLQHKLFDRLVFGTIRDFLGGQLKYAMSGGAAAPYEVLCFMEDLGIPVVEGYGLSETSPIITVNSTERGKRKLGTVGLPIAGVDVRFIDPDTLEEVPPGGEGEIIVSGPIVMKGYRNLPEENAKVFLTMNGKRYFRTGDKGRFVDGKFLKITGRIKEQFKLENGKYVAPVPLEEMICKSAYVFQAYVGMANKDNTIALIVPELNHLKDWCVKQGILQQGEEFKTEMLRDSRVVDMFRLEVERAFRLMKRFERPQRWAIVEEPFSVANQTLTPKLSLRRHNIVVHYKQMIDGMYAGTHGYAITEGTANARPATEGEEVA